MHQSLSTLTPSLLLVTIRMKWLRHLLDQGGHSLQSPDASSQHGFLDNDSVQLLPPGQFDDLTEPVPFRTVNLYRHQSLELLQGSTIVRHLLSSLQGRSCLQYPSLPRSALDSLVPLLLGRLPCRQRHCLHLADALPEQPDPISTFSLLDTEEDFAVLHPLVAALCRLHAFLGHISSYLGMPQLQGREEPHPPLRYSCLSARGWAGPGAGTPLRRDHRLQLIPEQIGNLIYHLRRDIVPDDHSWLSLSHARGARLLRLPPTSPPPPPARRSHSFRLWYLWSIRLVIRNLSILLTLAGRSTHRRCPRSPCASPTIHRSQRRLR